MTNFKEYLANQLKERQARNPRYSLRAFASNVGLSPAQLSQILSGKRTVTLETIHKVSHRLGVSPIEKREFMRVESEEPALDKKTLQLNEDQFTLIADWYHLAILGLAHQSRAKKDPLWISEKLGITFFQAKEALARLERLGLIEEGKRLRQKTAPLSILSEAPSPAIQKFHRQVLNLADEKLSTVPPSRRDFSAVTFNISPKNLKRAQSLIQKFQEELCDLLSTQEDSETYMLSCQFFPLTKETQGDSQ